jgi:hypothetical protein
MDSVVLEGLRIGFERVGSGPAVLLAGGTGCRRSPGRRADCVMPWWMPAIR